MKYTIEGFSQAKLIQNGMDSKDAVFLRWFVDFQATNRMIGSDDADGNRYYWIDHGSLCVELPLLTGFTAEEYQQLIEYKQLRKNKQKVELPKGLEKRYKGIRRYLKRLEDRNILYPLEIRRGKDRGTAIYYRINPELLFELTSSSSKQETTGQEWADNTTTGQKCPLPHWTDVSTATLDKSGQWDSSTKDSSINTHQQANDDDFQEATNEDIEGILEILEVLGVKDFLISREKIKQAINNGMKSSQAYEFFADCLKKATKKDNPEAYALSLFADLGCLKSFQEKSKVADDIYNKPTPRLLVPVEDERDQVTKEDWDKMYKKIGLSYPERETSDQSAVAEQSAVGLF